MKRLPALMSALALVGCGNADAVFRGSNDKPSTSNIEEFEDEATVEEEAGATEVAVQADDPTPVATVVRASGDSEPDDENEVVDGGDSTLEVDDVLFDTKGAWTLRFDDLRSGKHHLIGCQASASHFYNSPTVDDIQLYREQLYNEFVRLERDTFTVWTSTPDPNNGIGFYVVNLMNGDVSTDVSVFGGRHNILCQCSDLDLGETCGGADPLGTVLDTMPAELPPADGSETP